MAYEEYVKKASETYGVSEELINAVIQQESGGNAKAVSSAGAQGLMQLMPSTARMLGVSNTFDPEQNIMGGTKYLSQLLDKYDGDEESALAAYYAGPGNVDRYGKEKYSTYYTGVSAKKSSGVSATGVFDGLNWLGKIVLVVCIIGCLGLGIAFLYFAANEVM